MNKNQIEKVQRFLADTVMSQAVYEVVRATFLKTRPSAHKYPDVNFLAAERIAADLLEEGWKELGRLKAEDLEKQEPKKQVGL